MITCTLTQLRWRSRTGFVLDLKITFLLTLSLLMCSSIIVMMFVDIFNGELADDYAGKGAILCTLYLMSMIVHELGHGMTYKLFGLPWTAMSLGTRVFVRTDGTPTHDQQLVISFAGPFLHVLLGAAVLVMGHSVPVLLISGAVIVIEGLCNLLLPYHRSSDAAKLYRSLRHTLAGRGREPAWLPHRDNG